MQTHVRSIDEIITLTKGISRQRALRLLILRWLIHQRLCGMLLISWRLCPFQTSLAPMIGSAHAILYPFDKQVSLKRIVM